MARPGPIRAHSTEVSTRSWSGNRMETRLGAAEAKKLRQAFAWVDPDADGDNKADYKFIHHEVSAGGEVGPANVRACRSGIGNLNGARGGADIPNSHRPGVHRHLARHLRDAGVDPTALK